MQGLGGNGIGLISEGVGVSGDGSVVAVESAGGFYRWTAAGGLGNSLGTGNAFGISPDGSRIVGDYTPAGNDMAFEWAAASGITSLPNLPNGGNGAIAWAVSADDSTVAGGAPASPNATYTTAARWAGGSVSSLGTLPGDQGSVANAVSADGSVIVGISVPNDQAFRWTPATGMVGLGYLPGESGSEAFGVSADGSVVVGAAGVSQHTLGAFIWDATDGMRSIQSLLTSEGLGSALTGWSLTEATAVTPDGKTIVGNGFDPQGHEQAWIAHMSPLYSWTTLASTLPNGDGAQNMLLLPNGTVIAHGTGNSANGFASPNWYLLQPDSAGNYSTANATITALAPMTTGRRYFASEVLPNDTVFVYGGEFTSITLTGSITAASPVVAGLSSTTQLAPGMQVIGAGIPANTTIVSVNGPAQITLSANATTTTANLSLAFSGQSEINTGEYFTLGQSNATPWRALPTIPGPATPGTLLPSNQFGDQATELLNNDTILAADPSIGTGSTNNSFVFNVPGTYYDVNGTWTATATTQANSTGDNEDNWVLLPGGDVIDYEVRLSDQNPASPGSAQLFVPAGNALPGGGTSTGQWVNASNGLTQLTSTNLDGDLGPGVLLPYYAPFNGPAAMYFGANGSTAFYNPSTNSWTSSTTNAFDQEPSYTAPGGTTYTPMVSEDGPAAVLPNGDVLVALSQQGMMQGNSPTFPPPTRIYLFDPTLTSGAAATAFTDVTPSDANLTTNNAYQESMLVLPTGQVLMSDSTGTMWLYSPLGAIGTPQAGWRPAITGITQNGGTTFTLTGTQLNGVSQGAYYGDDQEMASNYPIIQLQNASGNVYYARTSNWSLTGVATGSAPETVQFTPAGVPPGTYTLYVIANGISSAGQQFTVPAPDATHRLQVVSAAADVSTPGAVNGVIVTFSEAIQPSTFVPAAVDSLTGPAGAIAPTGVSELSPTQYEVTFAPQSAAGNYTLVLGPYIADLAGNLMDQNGNGAAGEAPGDEYATTFGLPLPAALPMQEYFDGGVAHGFVSQSGSWSVAGGRYDVAAAFAGSDEVSLLQMSAAVPSSLELSATLNAAAASGTYYSNGFLIFDYQSPTNFKFAGAFIGRQQWVIGHRDANGWEVDASAGDPAIAAGIDFNLQLWLQGTNADLLVNGAGKVSFNYAAAFTGSAGLGAENSLTQFDNLAVLQPAAATLPAQENFDDGQAHYFSPQAGGWGVNAGHYVAGPVAGGDALTSLLVNGTLPSNLEFDVTMNAAAASGGYYSNGFLIFDYQSPTNFKFAGAFVGLQQWVIGHRDSTGWHIDAATSDPTIAADTDFGLRLLLQGAGASLVVNGTAEVSTTYGGNFTGSVGLGTENGVTQFDNLTVQPYSPPTGGTLPITENFDDGVAHYFSPQEGAWAVGGGRYGDTPVNGGDAVSALLVNGTLPTSLEFDVLMNAAAGAGGFYSNGFVVFDYQSPTNFKFAGAFVGLQQWVIGHRDSAGWHNDAAAGDPAIAAGTDFGLQLLLQGSDASLLVNGTAKVTSSYAVGFTGSVGLGTENGVTQFDNLTVQPYNPPGGGTLPITENFSDGVAHYFSPQEGAWAVGGGRYGDTPVNGGDAVSTLLVNGGVPSSLEFDVTMNAAAASGSYYSNGFIIFDYQSPTNFKFAGAFVGLQRWVIGHRDASGWEIDASAGDSAIAPGTDFGLQLLLQGTNASLLVNGVSKVSHGYASAFSGSVGLGSENGLVQFTNLTVKQGS